MQAMLPLYETMLRFAVAVAAQCTPSWWTASKHPQHMSCTLVAVVSRCCRLLMVRLPAGSRVHGRLRWLGVHTAVQ